jgi:DNA-binding response OmpR family regulator
MLLVSSDPQVRDSIGVAIGGVRRGTGEPVELLEASDGVRGAKMAWRYEPEIVVADEISSRMGAFALAKELTGAATPFAGRIVILLDRKQDTWLASWSGADAWFVKPINPFELADTVKGFLAGADEEAV